MRGNRERRVRCRRTSNLIGSEHITMFSMAITLETSVELNLIRKIEMQCYTASVYDKLKRNSPVLLNWTAWSYRTVSDLVISRYKKHRRRNLVTRFEVSEGDTSRDCWKNWYLCWQNRPLAREKQKLFSVLNKHILFIDHFTFQKRTQIEQIVKVERK